MHTTNACTQIVQHRVTIERDKAKIDQLEREMAELLLQREDHLAEIENFKDVVERDKSRIGALLVQEDEVRRERERVHEEEEKEQELRNAREKAEVENEITMLKNDIALLKRDTENEQQKCKQAECAHNEAVAVNMMLQKERDR
jgi:chromosome segregation ATPase